MNVAALRIARARFEAAAVSIGSVELHVLYAGLEHRRRFHAALQRPQYHHRWQLSEQPDGCFAVFSEENGVASLDGISRSIELLNEASEMIAVPEAAFADATFIGPALKVGAPWLALLVARSGTDELWIPSGRIVGVSWIGLRDDPVYADQMVDVHDGIPAEWKGNPPEFWDMGLRNVLTASVEACDWLLREREQNRQSRGNRSPRPPSTRTTLRALASVIGFWTSHVACTDLPATTEPDSTRRLLRGFRCIPHGTSRTTSERDRIPSPGSEAIPA